MIVQYTMEKTAYVCWSVGFLGREELLDQRLRVAWDI